MPVINNQTFNDRDDYYAGTNGTLIKTTIEPISTKLVFDFTPAAADGFQSAERVNLKTKLNFYFAADYSYGLEVTYSCPPKTALHGGVVDIKQILENMQDGIFVVEQLAGVNPYNHHLNDKVWMDVNCAEVARYADLHRVGSIWSGSRDLTMSLSDKDSHFALKTLTLLLNGNHGYKDSVFTPKMLEELRVRIKQTVINQLTSADGQPLPSYQ